MIFGLILICMKLCCDQGCVRGVAEGHMQNLLLFPLDLLYVRAVNDLGGTMDGTGRGKKLADDVVDIIRSRGGTAVANYGECS